MCPICHCLPSDRTRHMVNDPKLDYSGILEEGKGRERAEARALLDYDTAQQNLGALRPQISLVGLYGLISKRKIIPDGLTCR